MTTTKRAILQSADIIHPLAFIFGGNAEFTIRNVQSGNGYKYNVIRSKKDRNVYFIKFCDKRNGEWTYAGFFRRSSNGVGVSFIKGKKGRCDKEDAPIRGLFYAMNHGQDKLPAPMEMHHHGRCCCCGKVLTDKTSVEKGMGPICAAKNGL